MHIVDLIDSVHESVLDYFVFVNEPGARNSLEESFTGKLEEEGDRDDARADHDDGAPLSTVQRRGSREHEEPLDHCDLEDSDEDDGQPEVPVELREQFLEHVPLGLPDLPAVDVVEDLQEHERAQDVGEHPEFRLG